MKIWQPVVLPDLQHKGLERKEAFLLKAFLDIFVATCGEAILSTLKKQTLTKNVTGPPATKSGYAIGLVSYINYFVPLNKIKNLQILRNYKPTGPGPLKVITTEPAGNINTFAAKKQTGNLLCFQCFGGQFVG